eukprot:s50_g60.t1
MQKRRWHTALAGPLMWLPVCSPVWAWRRVRGQILAFVVNFDRTVLPTVRTQIVQDMKLRFSVALTREH